MIIKDNMANMCAKVTSTYMEFTLAFGPKPEFSFSFKSAKLILNNFAINVTTRGLSINSEYFFLHTKKPANC